MENQEITYNDSNSLPLEIRNYAEIKAIDIELENRNWTKQTKRFRDCLKRADSFQELVKLEINPRRVDIFRLNSQFRKSK